MQNLLARIAFYKAKPINKTARNVVMPGEPKVLKRKPKPDKAKETSSKYVKCKICGNNLLKKNESGHMKRVHLFEKSATEPSQGSQLPQKRKTTKRQKIKKDRKAILLGILRTTIEIPGGARWEERDNIYRTRIILQIKSTLSLLLKAYPEESESIIIKKSNMVLIKYEGAIESCPNNSIQPTPASGRG